MFRLWIFTNWVTICYVIISKVNFYFNWISISSNTNLCVKVRIIFHSRIDWSANFQQLRHYRWNELIANTTFWVAADNRSGFFCFLACQNQSITEQSGYSLPQRMTGSETDLQYLHSSHWFNSEKQNIIWLWELFLSDWIWWVKWINPVGIMNSWLFHD